MALAPCCERSEPTASQMQIMRVWGARGATDESKIHPWQSRRDLLCLQTKQPFPIKIAGQSIRESDLAAMAYLACLRTKPLPSVLLHFRSGDYPLPGLIHRNSALSIVLFLFSVPNFVYQHTGAHTVEKGTR